MSGGMEPQSVDSRWEELSGYKETNSKMKRAGLAAKH